MKNSSPFSKIAPLLCASLLCVLALAVWLNGGSENESSPPESDDSLLSGIVKGSTSNPLATLPDSDPLAAKPLAEKNEILDQFESYMGVWASSSSSPSWLREAIAKRNRDGDPPVGFNGNEVWVPNASWLERAAPSPASNIGGGTNAAVSEVKLIPWVCFAPGTSKETMDKAQERASGGLANAPPGSEFHASAFQFVTPSRWTSTAVNDTVVLGQGDSVTLTWSIIPDGTELATLDSGNPSNFNAFMNGIYGGRSVWLPIMASVFDRWGANTGIRYVYEPNDDKAPFPDSPGVLGVRGDVRVGGHLVDGPSNVIAYTYFPGTGDMIIDTGDNFYDDTSNQSRKMRNVLGHEAGHGIGLAHVCPINETKLMEPFATVAFSGPQHDDLYASHTQYGDRFEDIVPDAVSDNNDSRRNASQLGILNNGLTNLSPLSIDSATDEDYLSFETAGHSAVISIAIRPIGQTYLEGPQSQCDNITFQFNSLTVQDLSFELLDGVGTVLASEQATGTGEVEMFTDLQLPVSTGPFVLHVSGEGSNDPQLYYAEISITGGIPSPEMTAGDAIANEGDGTIDFPIQLSEAYAVEATVNYDLTSISATVGVDTPVLGGSLTIPANESNWMLKVPLTDDAIDEAVETFRVRFTDPYHVTLGTTEVIGTITDNDIDPTLEIEGFKMVGEISGSFELQVELSEVSPNAVSAQVNLIPVTATADVDYEPIVGNQIVFLPGATVSSTRITLFDDSEPETDETFIVQLVNPTNGGILHGTSLVTILDDDALPLLAKSMKVSVDRSNEDISIEWDAIPDRPYSILYSTDLATWIPLPGGQGITTTNAKGTYTFTPEPGERRFYRMTDAIQ